MKKIAILSVILLTLTSCWSWDTDTQTQTKTQDNLEVQAPEALTSSEQWGGWTGNTTTSRN